MLAYIKGEIADKQIGYIIVDVNGLGYKIYMSEIGRENVGNIGDIVKVHTYYRVTEDDISIFGFCTKEELRMFELLIQVSGIGAKTAVTMLGCIEPSQFAIAVISDDINTLKKLKINVEKYEDYLRVILNELCEEAKSRKNKWRLR